MKYHSLYKTLACAAAALLLTGCAFFNHAPVRLPGTPTPQPTATPQANAQPTPTPVPTPDPALGFLDESLYEGTILAETPAADDSYLDETLFIGDSNTVRYEMLGGTSLANNLGCAGMGIGSITGFPFVDFEGYERLMTTPEAIRVIQPRRVVFGFGSNNLTGDAAANAETYRSAIKACYEAYPYFTVIVSAVPPLDQNRTNTALEQERADALNEALVKMCAEEGWYFLNSAEAMKDWETGWAREGYTIQDGLHLSEAGVDAYIEYVRTHAAPETADTRPTLKPIPSHSRSPVDMLPDPTPAPDAAQESGSGGAVTIEYKLEGQGRLEGNLEQTLKPGDAAEGVWIYPAEGWRFTHWEISIPNQSYSEQECLRLTIPEDYTQAKVVATAFTEPAE